MAKKRTLNRYNAKQQGRGRRGGQMPHRQAETEEAPERHRVQRRTTPVHPLTQAQAVYDEAFRTKRIIFGIGPAGAGKTWFAAMRAAEALDRGETDRIYVTRPVVDAEEKLGYLPGDLMEKYEPYLRPVRDALEEYFGTGHLEYLLRKKIIEPRPLAFLRGATLKHAWVIADEMQNATVGQHKLLLTRIGENSTFVINGDPSQIDIPRHTSGLMDAVERMGRVAEVASVLFDRHDIVRDGLVQKVVEAYES